MQNRSLLLLVILLSLVLVLIKGSQTTFFYSTPNIRIKTNDAIESIDMEEYVIGVVASEMPASFDIEALKAQAVAARTYATYKMQHSSKNYDVVTSVANQGYITIEKMKDKWKDNFDKYYAKVKEAVISTKGEVMHYNDEVIESFYFALSNGWTENSELVFNESKEYLQSVPSTYDKQVNSFTKTINYTKEEICNLLNIKCDRLQISNIERSSTNRVNYITINDIKYKGTDIRKKLKLRSTDFTITENNGIYSITTKGYGHGVGMSQYGANGMAKAGANYKEILEYYYKNIKISSI